MEKEDEKEDYKILPVIDRSDGYKKKKELIFDLPCRLCICGGSTSGKSTILVNLLGRFYKDDFEPENIYIISPSAYSDPKLDKLIKFLEIPNSNVFEEMDENILNEIYFLITEDFKDHEEEKKIPPHYAIVFDDVGFSGGLRRRTVGSIIERLFCNGRHYNISLFVCVQQYQQLMKCAREQASGFILFACGEKQLDSIAKEVSTVPIEQFKQAFRDVTGKPYNFMVVNYSNKREDRFMSGFNEIIRFAD